MISPSIIRSATNTLYTVAQILMSGYVFIKGGTVGLYNIKNNFCYDINQHDESKSTGKPTHLLRYSSHYGRYTLDTVLCL